MEKNRTGFGRVRAWSIFFSYSRNCAELLEHWVEVTHTAAARLPDGFDLFAKSIYGLPFLHIQFVAAGREYGSGHAEPFHFETHASSSIGPRLAGSVTRR